MGIYGFPIKCCRVVFGLLLLAIWLVILGCLCCSLFCYGFCKMGRHKQKNLPFHFNFIYEMSTFVKGESAGCSARRTAAAAPSPWNIQPFKSLFSEINVQRTESTSRHPPTPRQGLLHLSLDPSPFKIIPQS